MWPILTSNCDNNENFRYNTCEIDPALLYVYINKRMNMGKINIDNIEPGMILNHNVTDYRGTVLLSAGKKITEKNIRIFRMWGITEVDVKGVEKEDLLAKAMAQIEPALRQEAESHALNIFYHTDRTHPAIAELFEQCKFRYIRQKSLGEEDIV